MKIELLCEYDTYYATQYDIEYVECNDEISEYDLKVLLENAFLVNNKKFYRQFGNIVMDCRYNPNIIEVKDGK